MAKLKVLDLFSGIGGFSLGLERTGGFETVAFCEIDEFCQKVLAKHWPNVPIIGDIKDVTKEKVPAIDVLTAGFPCQPFSQAGKQQGASDSRYLWPELIRAIRSVKPRYIILENVPGLLSINEGREFGIILKDLAQSGYAVEWEMLSAAAFGAHHLRKRVWIVGHLRNGDVAHSEGVGRKDGNTKHERTSFEARNSSRHGGKILAHAQSDSRPGKQRGRGDYQGPSSQGRERLRVGLANGGKVCNSPSEGSPDWAGGTVQQPRPLTEFERPSGREVEYDFRGVAHGVSRRVHQLRALGNAVVPQVVTFIGECLLEFDIR